MERHPNCSDRPRYPNGGTVASTPRYKRFMRKGPGLWFPALLVRFATPSFGRFLRNLLAVLRRFHLDEVDGHLAFGVHAVAHQNMHSYLRAVRPPGRALLDAGVGTDEPVEAPGVERLELYKVPGVGRTCPVCGDIEGLPLKQAVRMEWWEEVALCVSAGGGDVERGMRRDGDDGPLVGVAVQRAGEGLRYLVVCGDRDGCPRRGGSGSSQSHQGGQRQRPEHHLPAMQSKVHAFVLSLRLLALSLRTEHLEGRGVPKSWEQGSI